MRECLVREILMIIHRRGANKSNLSALISRLPDRRLAKPQPSRRPVGVSSKLSELQGRQTFWARCSHIS